MPSLPALHGPFQTRRRFLRRGNSGERRHHRTRDPAGLLLLSAGCRVRLRTRPGVAVYYGPDFSCRFLPPQLEPLVRIRLHRGIITKVRRKEERRIEPDKSTTNEWTA